MSCSTSRLRDLRGPQHSQAWARHPRGDLTWPRQQLQQRRRQLRRLLQLANPTWLRHHLSHSRSHRCVTLGSVVNQSRCEFCIQICCTSRHTWVYCPTCLQLDWLRFAAEQQKHALHLHLLVLIMSVMTMVVLGPLVKYTRTLTKALQCARPCLGATTQGVMRG